VIFSDMVEESDRLKMTNEAMAPRMVDRFIAHERSGPYFPRLGGVRVYVAGAGVTTRATSSLKNEQIEAFWLRFLRATGAQIDPDHYGSTLTRFP
jgi:hypothetical protein